MGYSQKCKDRTTRYDPGSGECVSCIFRAGSQVSPNCGYDDSKGQHEAPWRKCDEGTWNDGSRALCVECSPCESGFIISSVCNSTTDTRCEEERSPVSEPPAVTEVDQYSSTVINTTLVASGSGVIVCAVAAALFIALTLLCVVVIYMKRRRGQQAAVMTFRKRSSLAKDGFSPLSDELDEVLSPDILSAPLQTVLDQLDVLEELVILLDPDSQEAKSTKHLASHCSFPSTWVTYTYSLKDSKSPLVAVLEGVTSRHPDWTVAHLAKMLRQMERNDALAVLAKLGPDKSVEQCSLIV